MIAVKVGINLSKCRFWTDCLDFMFLIKDQAQVLKQIAKIFPKKGK
jgi:hypothetical protein